jgi:hypothetical protein
LQRSTLERATAARQILGMNIRTVGLSFICALVLGLPVLSLAQADGAAVPPAPKDLSCDKIMDQAMLMLLKMPAGVEKMAAQKELVSAKVDNDKGDTASCKTHVNTAIGAMTAHNPG